MCLCACLFLCVCFCVVQVTSVSADGDASGVLTAGGSVFVWGKSVTEGTPYSRWVPEHIPVLRHAIHHIASRGCPHAQRQLAAAYGRSVGHVVKPRAGEVACCQGPLTEGDVAYGYIISSLSITEYGVAVSMQMLKQA